MGLSRVMSSRTSRSRIRNPASPSREKMYEMSTPVRDSTSASLSRNGARISRARCLPTAVLPEPMGPMRKTLAVRGDMAREHSGNEAAARVVDGGGRYLCRNCRRSVDADAFAQDLGRHEDQQLVLVVGTAGGLEDAAEHRDVAQVRHLLLGLATLGLEDAAENHGLAVVHQNLRGDLAGVDRGHLLTGAADDDLAHAVLLDVEV